MKTRRTIKGTSAGGVVEEAYTPSNPQPTSEAYICSMSQLNSSGLYFMTAVSGAALASSANPRIEVINDTVLLASALVGSKQTLNGCGFNPFTGQWLSDALEELGFTATRSSNGDYDGTFLPIVNYQTAMNCLLIPTSSSYGRRNTVTAIPIGIAASSNEISPRIHAVVVRYLLCPSASLPVSETNDNTLSLSGSTVIYKVYYTTQAVINAWQQQGGRPITDADIGFTVETLALPKAN